MSSLLSSVTFFVFHMFISSFQPQQYIRLGRKLGMADKVREVATVFCGLGFLVSFCDTSIFTCEVTKSTRPFLDFLHHNVNNVDIGSLLVVLVLVLVNLNWRALTGKGTCSKDNWELTPVTLQLRNRNEISMQHQNKSESQQPLQSLNKDPLRRCLWSLPLAAAPFLSVTTARRVNWKIPKFQYLPRVPCAFPFFHDSLYHLTCTTYAWHVRWLGTGKPESRTTVVATCARYQTFPCVVEMLPPWTMTMPGQV